MNMNMNTVINEIITLYMNTDEDTRLQIREVLIYLEKLNNPEKEEIAD